MSTTALDHRLLACAYGAYPWDEWERSALAAGLSPELAALGRSLMREAYQHDWCERLKAECGWSDEGRAMLRRVLAHPRRTAARWEWLLSTDGLRFDPWEHREPRHASGRAEIDNAQHCPQGEPPGAVARQHYEDSPCWNRLRSKWNREQAKLNAQPVEAR
jgi:hypothetical protein